MNQGWSGPRPDAQRPDVTDLQTATAAFGQFAIECADVTVTQDRALELVTRLLDVRAAALIRCVDGRRVEIVESHGSLGTCEDPACALGDGDVTLPAEVFSASEGLTKPLAIRDWQASHRLVSPLARRLPTVRSSLLVGLTLRDRPYAITAVDTRVRDFRPSEIDAVVTVAHLLSAAMDRHRHETAQAAVAAFGRFALESRSVETTLQRGVDLMTDVLDASFGFLARVAGAGRLEVLYGRGPLGEPFGGEVDLPPALEASFTSLEPIVTDRSFPWPPQLHPARGAEVSSVTAGVEVAGGILRVGVVETDPRRFADSDVDFVSSMAHLLAAAVKRDQFEAELRATSDVLQRALLPAALPALDGVESVARYLPARYGDVGGDWYDVLPLPYGGVGLVMGDVEGHDSAAAAVMGQVRNVLRAYVAEGHLPTEVLRKVNRFVSLHTDRLVTCFYAELRPGDLTITCVSAGHPLPLAVEPRQRVRVLPARSGLLLGVYPEQDYEERTTVLAAGSTLLLFSDGLVDGAGLGVRFTDEELVARVASLRPDEPLQRLADELAADRPDGAVQRDDVALLAVRLTSSASEGAHAERVFTPSASASRAARRYVADLLGHWDLLDLCDAATLAVSELVTNAVMHTTSSVRLVLNCLAQGVWIGVHDTNDRLPVHPAPCGDLDPGGRGLGIVDQIADRWGITPTPAPGGKTVWLELLREPA